VDTRHYADSPWVMPVLFIVLGLTVAAGRMAAEDVGLLERPQPASWRPWVVLAVAVVLIAAGVYGRFSRQIMAAWYTNLGAIDEARAELAPGPGSMADQTSPDPLTQTILTEADRQTYYASAEAWYRRALETDPSYSNANRRLGNMLVTLNRYEQGVPLLETALATEPAYGATIKGLGLAYVWVGRIDDAVRTIALHDDPDSIAEELYTWGYFRDSQNRPLLAARAWATAQMMYPDSGDISVWLLIADTYRRADDLDSARRWYERVLEVEPDNRLARDGLEQVG
jgi:tetratricopeptide (TPR) repeat protein